jgi:hypothetical protein
MVMAESARDQGFVLHLQSTWFAVPSVVAVRHFRTQLGYKSVKYLSHITVTVDLKNIGKGFGSAAP